MFHLLLSFCARTGLCLLQYNQIMKITKNAFANMFKKFTDVWIAYDPKNFKVFGTGKSLNAAINRAKKNGLAEPTVIKAPKKHLPWMI